MIHYQLRCEAGHGFDGWFKDAASFDRQAGLGLLACPECGSGQVRRALMAPAVQSQRQRPTIDQQGAPQSVAQSAAQSAAMQPSGPAGAGAPGKSALLPDQVRAVLQRLRAEVERSCEHVGDRFADEALAIHRGEAQARGIYGDTTPEQAEKLAEEGVQVARIPWIPRADG